MDEQELYREYQKGKEQAEASGINALTRDIELTGEKVVDGAKNSIDMTVDGIDDSVSEVASNIQRDANQTVSDVKNELKQDIGIGNAEGSANANAKASRFAEAASGKGLTDNIKEPEKDDEIYMPRKYARYQ